MIADLSKKREQFQIGIVAHISREEMATELGRAVHPLFVSVDSGVMGVNTNHRAVWSHLAHEYTEWSVVLEDDAAPVIGFREHLANVLTAAPTPIISLYLGMVRPPQYQRHIEDALAKADCNDAHWIVGKELLHAVGYAIRTELVPDMLANQRAYLPIDQAVGRWARSRNHGIGYTVPSLVDHRDTPTLLTPDTRDGGDHAVREPGRVAHRVGTHLSWNSRSVELC